MSAVRGVSLVRTFHGQVRFFRCGHLHFLDRIFRNLWCVRTDNGGWGVNFSRFCVDFFYGRPLICFTPVVTVEKY